MRVINVDSTAALKIAYDSGKLFVQYIEGDWYKYSPVPESVFERLQKAESVGYFLNKEIKPNYFCEKCLAPKI